MSKIVEKYPELKPFEADIELRMSKYVEKLRELTGCGGDKGEEMSNRVGKLSDFANAHRYYGFHHCGAEWVYREWAPAADAVYLTGDFNSWNPTATELKSIGGGNWEVTLPDTVLHQCAKVLTVVRNGGRLTKHVPLYARRAVQDSVTKSWCCEVWDETEEYPWTDADFSCTEKPIIYEAHVGMAGEEKRIASYREFADKVLPHIKDGGYNTIQLMGIMEHPFYGSAGYQVSSFYAASYRYGFPDELKYLINKAHGMGIRVLLDLVHSHAVGNSLEGINLFDGTDYQFFHAGARGEHPAWGTKCFNYGKNEVLHYLLSNVKFWIEEYHFDGFRFDGVTSMLYHDHALGSAFTELKQYFSLNTDTEAVTYLQLANTLAHEIKPDAITVAEDMSGMPGMCENVESGGIGFDFRLGMGLPDMWIKLIKEKTDEQWWMDDIWWELINRNAPTVAYAESHDQALVGDQTLIFRLAGAEMYEHMDNADKNGTVERAMCLHKLIRLITIGAGGTGYLNFMGNEFGHPEWIDFPSPANNDSFQYCRRQWSLLNNGYLKYRYLNAFDRAMINAVKEYRVLDEEKPRLMKINDSEHTIAFERGGLLFVFNFDPVNAYEGYKIPVSEGRDYELLFSSDDEDFGGMGRIAHGKYSAFAPGEESSSLRLYLPPRTAAVMR